MTERRCPCCGKQIDLATVVWQAIDGTATMSQIKASVRKTIAASDKEIYNAVTGLARRGRIRRLGYGRYGASGA